MTLRILLRRSKSEGQDHSLDVQRAGCLAFAAARGIVGPAVEYVGDGVAGDDVEGLRALRRLIADARPGDAVICRDHSRLGRDNIESNLAIRAIVSDAGALLYYYASGEQVRFATAVEQFVSLARGFGAQAELEAIRSRTREALRSRVKAGRLAGGECYGYRRQRVDNDGKGYTIAVVDPAEAAVIGRIYAWFVVDGWGLKKIAYRLNAEGVSGVRVKRRGSGSWSPSQVRDILRRERYRGVYVHGVVQRIKKGGKRIAKKADPADVIRVEIPEWQIVDDVTWYRAQAIFAARTPSAAGYTQARRESRAVYALSGIGRCAHCGGSIAVVNGLAYGCVRHKQRGPTVCPVSTLRPREVIERAVANAIREVCARPEVVEAIIDAARRELAAEQADTNAVDVEALRAELAEVKREQRNLLKVLAALDGDDPETMRELRARRDRAAQLETTIAVAAQPRGAADLADIEGALRREIADVAETLAGEPSAAKEIYRALFPEGLRFETHPSAKPARWVITGQMALGGKVAVTPWGTRDYLQGPELRLVA